VLVPALSAGGGTHGFIDRWPQVQQAAGTVSVQSDVSSDHACLRLRAHAFATDRPLREVVGDVVGHMEANTRKPRL
jgi:hypothetical protein